MILKPDKGNGVVLMNKIDYHNAMNQLFSDKTKFKIIKNDLTLTWLTKPINRQILPQGAASSNFFSTTVIYFLVAHAHVSYI